MKVLKVKQTLFGKEIDIHYCLEKLSFKRDDYFVSTRADNLLSLIDDKVANDEDLSLLPGVDQNGFIFGVFGRF